MTFDKFPRWLVILILTLSFSGFGLYFLTPIIQAQMDYHVFLPIIFKPSYEPEKGVSLAFPHCEDLATVGAGWYINFRHIPSSGCPSPDKRFVPVIYNAAVANDDASLATVIENAKASGWLIGFGEPNLPWNGNTTPFEGALAWRKIEAAALPAGIKLVSPFPSPHNPFTFIRPGYPLDPYGYNWTWNMVEEYQKLYGEKPHFDALGWNYYLINFPPNPPDLIGFLNARRQEALDRGYDIPFWLLEYAGACWHTDSPYPTRNVELMQLATPWFKNTSWVSRFAWFTNRASDTDRERSCRLIDNNNNLTQLGTLYIGY